MHRSLIVGIVIKPRSRSESGQNALQLAPNVITQHEKRLPECNVEKIALDPIIDVKSLSGMRLFSDL